MVQCKLPDRNPLLDFWDYGCYCGLGGGGTAVDQMDRCCQAHDECYDEAQNYESCDSFFDSPYFNFYEFECNDDKNITCLSSNRDCDMFICMCDKVAVDCFADASYNDSMNSLPTEVCFSGANSLFTFLWLKAFLFLVY
ncbi:phospholipase A2-like [Engraulis encrasicolus]|uniref:phospholipase A2-like n=1 Tax=Engraulis encrasicolus TaxID=184585 RepID=UPI002FD5C2C4